MSVLLVLALGAFGGVLGGLAVFIWALRSTHRAAQSDVLQGLVVRELNATLKAALKDDPPGLLRLDERWCDPRRN